MLNTIHFVYFCNLFIKKEGFQKTTTMGRVQRLPLSFPVLLSVSSESLSPNGWERNTGEKRREPKLYNNIDIFHNFVLN